MTGIAFGWIGSTTALGEVETPIRKLKASLKCRSCRKRRWAPLARLIKLTGQREVAPYKWVRPDEER